MESYSTPGLKGEVIVDMIDCVATVDSVSGKMAVSCINKHEFEEREITLKVPVRGDVRVVSLTGNSADDYNDIGRDNVHPFENPEAVLERSADSLRIKLPAHSVNIVQIG